MSIYDRDWYRESQEHQEKQERKSSSNIKFPNSGSLYTKQEMNFFGKLYKIINKVHIDLRVSINTDTEYSNAFKNSCEKESIQSTIYNYYQKSKHEVHCISVVYTKTSRYYIDCKHKIIADDENELELYYTGSAMIGKNNNREEAKNNSKKMKNLNHNQSYDLGAKSFLFSLFFIGIIIIAICYRGSISDFFSKHISVVFEKVNETANKYANHQRDKNGLYADNYDENGWAYVNGSWISNPRPGAFIRYAEGQGIATASKPISNAVVNNNTPINAYRDFASLEETYSLLMRVAEDLQYSDLEALWDSFSKYNPLPNDHFYEVDGKRFYSNQDLFDYKIQKAKEWGNKNDQNNDGVINCSDYAELFYKYASDAGYHVRYISNSDLNHAFNQVKIQNEWVAIEPQSAESGLERLPLESVRFPNYNPKYDKIRKEN